MGVHITDVGSIVDEKSKLNEVAKERLISAEDLSHEEEKGRLLIPIIELQ